MPENPPPFQLTLPTGLSTKGPSEHSNRTANIFFAQYTTHIPYTVIWNEPTYYILYNIPSVSIHILNPHSHAGYSAAYYQAVQNDHTFHQQHHHNVHKGLWKTKPLREHAGTCM